MIELPDWAVPNGAQMGVLDFGAVLTPVTGAEAQRIDRKGNRFKGAISLPKMPADRAEVVISRLLRAQREGLRIPYPLLVPQGSPGSPVVNGAGQQGHTLAIRGLTPGYTLRESYWLSIEDENGRHYLHKCGSMVRVDASGEAEIAIETALRWPFLDGAAIHLAVPMMQGLIEGEVTWTIPIDGYIEVQFVLVEAA